MHRASITNFVFLFHLYKSEKCMECGVFRINTRLNTLRILVKRKSKSQTEMDKDQIKANKVGLFHGKKSTV